MSYLSLPHGATCLPDSRPRLLAIRSTRAQSDVYVAPSFAMASGAVAIVYGFHRTPISSVYASCFLVGVFLSASRLLLTMPLFRSNSLIAQ